MTTQIKICGITTKDALMVCADADFFGLVFHPASRRAVTIPEAAALASAAPPRVKRVGLFVDADDALLQGAVETARLAMIQLHGNETPARVAEIAARFHLPVMKAIRVAGAADIARARDFEGAADWLLFDAHVPGQAGGTGKAFDWTLLKNFSSRRPWMLSGGLNAANIGAALALLKPTAVDVSSGVEAAPGRKDPALIADFIETVRAL